jgi:hypothetical protein
MVPRRYNKDPPLGRWVLTQCIKYRNDKLLSNRLALLNSIEFEWDGVQSIRKENNLRWMKIFQKLVAYQKVHENTMVPYRYDEYPPLGGWVFKQRRNYKNDNLLLNRITLLNSIDFEWDGFQLIRKENNEKWMKMFHKLVAYVKKVHKNSMVPQHHKEYPKLGGWVGTQRQRYKNGEVFPNRVTLLNSIEFDWEVGKGGKVNDEKWMKMFQKLVAYKKVQKKFDGTATSQGISKTRRVGS